MPHGIPLVFVGDSPYGPSGLGRILRDLRTRVAAAFEAKAEVHAIGWEAGPAWGGDGHYHGHQDTETWGARALAQWWPQHVDRRQYGIVVSIWDPARCYGLKQAQAPNAWWWGYFPIDGHNIHGTISGPPDAAVQAYDRVLAYTRFGRRVLSGVRGDVGHLPHGFDAEIFRPRLGDASWTMVEDRLAPVVTPESLLIGCVATNQPRKDLGLVFQVMAQLTQRYPEARLWLHTDRDVGTAWSVPQLVQDFQLRRKVVVTHEMEDVELAACYSYCAATVAPGLGEGFGYPIVESLACGTPVVHGTYGGGAELVPVPDWTFPERDHRIEGPYALVRPVYHAEDVANALERAVDWRRREPRVVQEYCTGAVAHLEWERLWPHWAEWFRSGLEAL